MNLESSDPWMEQMRRGDFAAAWRLSDAALRARTGVPCWHLPRHEQWLWDGAPLAGQRVLVRCYHGLGDTVQFIRYAPLLREVAREVIVWAQPVLVELLRGAAGVDRVLPLHDGTPEADFDADVEIMELPHVFRTTLATIPARVPYLGEKLQASSFKLQERSKGQETRRNIGLVWQSGGWDPARSVPVAMLVAALAEVPGVTLHALQRGPALAEWRGGWGPVSGSDDVIETARAMLTLDLIISVDSFPAHLAGALACPVWTLLHAAPDWRWMTGRGDSPWYPTMRLFRQERAGDWERVVGRVEGALREMTNDK